jgi:hypothetical protein
MACPCGRLGTRLKNSHRAEIISAACIHWCGEDRGLKIRLFISVVIFLGSYLPLSAILLVQDYDYTLFGHSLCWNVWANNQTCTVPLAHPKLALIIFGICLFSFGLSLLALTLSRPSSLIKVKEAKYIPAELMSYILPYVVAFMGIGYQETGKLIGLAIFLAWMFWITHKSGQILLNPVLAVLGWRLYEIKYAFPGDPKENEYIDRALARGNIESGQSYAHVKVQDIVVLGVTHS